MSNQPTPARPWFRLASIGRPAPQAPTPTPEPTPAPPRTTPVRPAFRATPPLPGGVSSVPTSPVSVGRGSQPSSPAADRKPTTVPASATTSSVPSSPVKTVQTAAAPTSSPPKTTTSASVPSSPAKPLATIASVPTSPTQRHSPKASITTVKPAAQSPIQSPRIKPPTAPPPSPLTLPPPQLKSQAELKPKIPLEAEQKTVLVQKTINDKQPKQGWRSFDSPQKDLDDNRNRKPSIPLMDGVNKEKFGHGKKLSSYSDQNSTTGMRVITIAGENKGAFMELIRSPQHQRNGFQGSPHRLHQKMVNSSTRTSGSDRGSDYQSYSSSGEEAGGGDGKMKDKSNASKTKPTNAFMNSNVQGVNNSIVYNSSCTHHDPGVHLSLHRKPTNGGFHVKERTNGYNS